jgi:hypothetical protein
MFRKKIDNPNSAIILDEERILLSNLKIVLEIKQAIFVFQRRNELLHYGTINNCENEKTN